MNTSYNSISSECKIKSSPHDGLSKSYDDIDLSHYCIMVSPVSDDAKNVVCSDDMHLLNGWLVCSNH